MPLHVHRAGDPGGTPVLALHGITGHGLRFRPLHDALWHLRWISVDLRGHGHSPWAPPWNLEQHVADALAVLDDEGVDRAVVVGHSFGGAVATHLARTAPGRVRRLVLLDPAIGLDPRSMLDNAEDARHDECWPTPGEARVARAETWEGVPQETVDTEIELHLEQHDDGGWRWRYARACVVAAWSEMARPAVVPPAGVPTLVVPATGAEFVSDTWLDACRAELGDDLTVTPMDTGHMVYLERPAEVARVLDGFLASSRP